MDVLMNGEGVPLEILRCEICAKSFRNANGLNQHFRTSLKHRDEPLGNGHLMCNVAGCGATFHRQCDFKQHARRKHADIAFPQAIPAIPPNFADFLNGAPMPAPFANANPNAGFVPPPAGQAAAPAQAVPPGRAAAEAAIARAAAELAQVDIGEGEEPGSGPTTRAPSPTLTASAAGGNPACPVCFERYSDQRPLFVITTCGHSGCQLCLVNHISGAAACHTCRKPTTLRSLIRVYVPWN